MGKAPSGLNRNGYARLSDLDSAGVRRISRELAAAQANLVARTLPIWRPSFRATGNSLYGWSRQWEYAYAVANLPSNPGKVLDAGSGMTFLPFYLSERGSEVFCCDHDSALKPIFKEAISLTGTNVEFTNSSIHDMPYADNTFDNAYCVSDTAPGDCGICSGAETRWPSHPHLRYQPRERWRDPLRRFCIPAIQFVTGI